MPLVIALVLLSLTKALATVTVTPATGGTNLSSDTAPGGLSPAWTALTTLTIAEATNTQGRNDIAAGTGVTLVLKAPAGFEFNTGATPGISFTGGEDITAASVELTDSTTVTITLTVAGILGNDSLDITGLQVRPTATGPIAVARRIYRPTTGGGTAVVSGINANATGSGGTSFGDLSQALGAFTKLQILVPGETAAPGTVSGKTGTPTAISVGNSFSVTVNSVDTYWNIVSSTHTVAITSSDPIAVLPADIALAGGTRNRTVTLRTAGTQTVTASDVTDGTKTAAISASISVTPDAANQLGIQTQPSATAIAGVAFAQQPVVRIEDQFGNLITTDNTTVVTAARSAGTGSLQGSLTATAVNGLATFTGLSHQVANTITIVFTKSGLNSATADSILVSPAAASQLAFKTQPGSATAGSAFGTQPVVATQDAFGNDSTVGLASSLIMAATLNAGVGPLQGTTSFNIGTSGGNGTVTFTNLRLDAAGASQQLTAIASGLASGVSSVFTVSAGALTKLQLLVPGETAAPGTASGKTGTPSAQVAGSVFDVTVNAVDAFWNLANNTHNVGITSSDSNATLPGNANLQGGTRVRAVTLNTVGAYTLTAVDNNGSPLTSDTSPAITVNADTFTKLQILLPGETASPGSATGKTGTPAAQTAGTAFTVTVNAVDANWNLITSATDTVGITSTDSNATPPASAALAGGTRAFSVTARTAGNWRVTASDISQPSITANQSPLVTINVGAFAQLQVIAPGENEAPGTLTGKTGAPTARTAGVSFNVTVNAVDANWNLVNTVTDTVHLTSSDGNALLAADFALTSGTRNGTVTFKTAGIQTVTASDLSNGLITANTSSSIPVNAAAFNKMQVLVPGEIAAPGTASGKTGTPTAQVSGVGFSVTANAVDTNWNLVPSVTNLVAITSSDGTASLPGNAPLVGGTVSLRVTLMAAGSSTVTASDVTQGAHTPNTSPGIQVIASWTVSGFAYGDANRNAVKDGAETGTGRALFAKIYPAGTPSRPAEQVVAVNLSTGAFSFLTITNGTYLVALDDNNSPSDVTPTLPDGWIGTEIQNQLRSNVVVNGADLSNQNFGLIQVATVRGAVFKDTGVGGGTANDGVRNGSEPGLSGVTVNLLNGGGGILDFATTDGSGNYVLVVPSSVVGGAQLKIMESNLSAYRSTGATVGDTGGTYNPAGDFVGFTFSTGASYLGVNFGDVPENQFTTGSPQSGPAGSVVFYAHAFTAGTAGQVTFSSSSAPSPANNGWNNALFRDLNCNGQIDSSEPMITGASTVAADEKICVIVKEFLPANAPFNAQDQITVTALFTYTGSNPLASAVYIAVDLTTVGTPTTAGLTLTKAVDKSTAFPGETITYTITYLNNSGAAISNVIIFDSTPAFTTFLSATAGTLPSALTGSLIVKPAVAGKGTIRWTFSGSLDPGQSGTVNFSVVIE